MTAMWATRPFEECIERVTYTTKIQRKDFLDGGAYPVVSQEEKFINGYWNDEADVLRLDRPAVIFGDHTRILKYVDFDFVLGADGVKVLKPKPFLYPKFFYYQLHTAPLDSLGYARHYRLLKEFEVSYPDLHEQQRIVAILDEAFAGIDKARVNAEQNLRNARELFESVREVALRPKAGWCDRAFNEICEIKHGFAFKSEFFVPKGDYVLLTPGNFFEVGGYRDRGEKQKFYVGEIPADYVLDKGALLVAMTEQAAGLLGSPIVVPESNKFLHNQRLGLVISKDGVEWSNEFFFHLFNTVRVREEIHATATGVKVRHTSPTKIGAVRVSFPTMDEQRIIVAKLAILEAKTRRLTAIYQQKLATLDELRQSLLARAFAGDL